jgi:Rps23 Pro-64 3,4-dihydroxylase Tpa1-like proline 4-hydroxylase
MIEVADNMFTENEIVRFETYVRDMPYNINTTDDGNFSSGAASPINMHSVTYKLILLKIYKEWPDLQKLELYDCHSNCFWPGEFTQFHTDNENEGAVTVLYYCNENEWKDGGTEVLFEDELRVESILPISGRLMRMPGNQLHRATSFRDKKRLNLAYKFRPYDD